MSIICKVDYSTALKYKGLNLKAKYNGKKHQVCLKVVCDDFTLQECIELAKSSPSIVMLEYQGLETNKSYLDLKPCGVYIGKVFDLGNNFTRDDIVSIDTDTPDGVVPIIHLPDDFNNIEFIWKLSKEFNRIRFCGGYLFNIEGIKIGAVGSDILSSGNFKLNSEESIYQGIDDVIEQADISILDIETTATKSESTKSLNKSPKSAPKKKQSVSFANLLFGNNITI